MAKSPVIQMQNWFMSNQHQWWCGPVGLNSSTQSDWFQYTEALQDATGRLGLNLICACSLKNILCDPEIYSALEYSENNNDPLFTL